ncbi:hypothetical protein ACER0C_013231 [Sarotherodon galilaeus]
MDPLHFSLLHHLLLLASLSSFPASADRRFGCLFENELCSPYEICVNDGMFGRCHSVPVKEIYTYDVSPSVVQRFRMLLEKLSNRGLTWEDDTTQQVLSKELSKLRRIPYRPQQTGPPVAQAMDPVDQRVKPVEVELSRNLQMYLQRLGLLPKTSTSSLSAPSKVSIYSPRPPFEATWLSLKRKRAHIQCTLTQHAERTQTQMRTPSQQAVRCHPSLSLLSCFSVLTDDFSQLDQRFIENVLKNVDRQHVDVDTLTPQDLDQLSSLIAEALQVVDQDKGLNRGLSRMRGPGPRDLEGELSDGEEEAEEEEEEGEVPRDELLGNAPTLKPQESTPSGSLFTKLLAYLDKSSFTGSPPAKNHYDDASETPRGQQVGLENVQSRTSEVGVAVQKKDTTQSVEELSEVEGWIKEVAPPPAALVYDEPHKKTMHVPELQLDVKASKKKKDDDVFGYVITDTDGLQTDEGLHLMEILARMAKIQMTDFAELSVVGPAVTFKVSPNAQNVSTADVANVAVQKKVSLEKEAKVSILEAGIADGSQINQIPTKYSQTESTKFLILTVVSILCIVGVLLASTVVYCLRHRSHHKLKEKLTNLGTDTSSDATATYQELCRQRMAVKPPAERPEPISSRINSVSSQFSDGGQAVSPSARSSISSWSEEPAHSNMDISTGHMILSYMEDHLKNKDRLEKEWEALCAYQAEPNACTIGLKDGNAKKNRSTAVVAYDHSRITLKVENSQGNSDYINASPIMDHDPRNPAYIATQGPLPSTVADFWQMVWENGCVVIVMLTPLVESGVKQCYHYWPDEGSNLYHIYEVNLVSEHIWCDDFLVRSFYLKNMQTNETRTVTQFHFLTWLNQNVPETSRTLLDFRRKVNKCYRGRSCPIIVHCSDGAGRTGTYILIDMVLNKMAKGAKEIDIAATLEHLRDQRPGMVQTKDQFEFALTAVAEEVNAILKALPQ